MASSDLGNVRAQRKLQRIKEELANEERLAAEAKAFKAAYSHHRAKLEPPPAGLYQVASDLIGSLPQSNDDAQRAFSRRLIYSSDLQNERYPRLPPSVPNKRRSLKNLAAHPVEAVPYATEVRPVEEPQPEETPPVQLSTAEASTEEAAHSVGPASHLAKPSLAVKATHSVEPADTVETADLAQSATSMAAARSAEPALSIEGTRLVETTSPIEVLSSDQVIKSAVGAAHYEDESRAAVVPQAAIAPEDEVEIDAELAPQADSTPAEHVPPAVHAVAVMSAAPQTPVPFSSRFNEQVSPGSTRSMTTVSDSENTEVASDTSTQSSRPSTPCVESAIVPEPLASSCKEFWGDSTDGQPDPAAINRNNARPFDPAHEAFGDVEVQKSLGHTSAPVQEEREEQAAPSVMIATIVTPSASVVQPTMVQQDEVEPPVSLLPPFMTPTSTLTPLNADYSSITEDPDAPTMVWSATIFSEANETADAVAPPMVPSATVFTDANDGSEVIGINARFSTEAEDETTSMRRSSSEGTLFINADDGPNEVLGIEIVDTTQANEDGTPMLHSASEGTIFFESMTGEEKRLAPNVKNEGSSAPQTDATVARRRAPKGPKLSSVAPV